MTVAFVELTHSQYTTESHVNGGVSPENGDLDLVMWVKEEFLKEGIFQ